MKANLMLLGATAIVLGAAAGIHYRIPVVIALVCLGLAGFSAVIGSQMIVTRKADIPLGESHDTRHEHHTGISAQFWGALFLIFSIPFGAYGVGYWVYGGDPPGRLLDRIVSSPLMSGLVVVAVGITIGLYGLTRLIGGRATFAETGIGTFERTATGIYVCTIGAVVVAAGALHALVPGTLSRMRDDTIRWALSLVK